MDETIQYEAATMQEHVLILSNNRNNFRRNSIKRESSTSEETALLLTSREIVDGDTHIDRSETKDIVFAIDSHCHHNKLKSQLDTKARTRLIVASVLCLIFMVAEIVGGILAHSLAIVSDAAHLLTDLTSFLVSLFAIHLASRQPTKKLSFGWYRAEILGALTSIFMLWILTGILVYMGIKRIMENEYDINAVIMLITASIGVVFNIIMGTTLHQHGHSHGGSSSSTESSDAGSENDSDDRGGNSHTTDYGTLKKGEHTSNKRHHSHSNINVKAAFIHVLGDLIQSVGVFIAALIIYFKPEWKIADPICTFIFSVLVLVTTFTVIRDIILVLMEGAPRGLNFDEVNITLSKVEGVKAVHDLRMWSLSMNKVALSAHLALEKRADANKVLKKATRIMQDNFNVHESTIQTERYVDEMIDCTLCKDPKN